MTPHVLAAPHVDKAAAALSAGGRFQFTARQLYYELIRRGALPAAGSPRDEALNVFQVSLDAHERAAGPVPNLIHPDPTALKTREISAPEALDFAVPRVLVTDRLDLFLFFAMNGFHRKIEMALLLWPELPSYVWQCLLAQLRAGLTTSFHVVHDADRAGYHLRESVRAALADHGAPDVANVGLTFGQAASLSVPVRSAETGEVVSSFRGFESESGPLLSRGAYADIEELAPLALLRWAYSRVSKGHEEIGFG